MRERLAERGIVYVPDFVSNAGGVLQIHAERAGWDADRLDLSLAAIGRRTFDLLDEAAATRALPLHVGRAVGLGPAGASPSPSLIERGGPGAHREHQ